MCVQNVEVFRPGRFVRFKNSSKGGSSGAQIRDVFRPGHFPGFAGLTLTGRMGAANMEKCPGRDTVENSQLWRYSLAHRLGRIGIYFPLYVAP